MKKLLKNLGIWIIIAMIVGIVVGIFMGEDASIFKPLGDFFIQLIKMLVVPLVFISIISGAAALGETKSAGLVGGLSIGYMMLTTVIAISVALGLSVIFQPGTSIESDTFNSNTKEYVLTEQNKTIEYIDVNIGESTETSIVFSIEAMGFENGYWLVYEDGKDKPSVNEIIALGQEVNFVQPTTTIDVESIVAEEITLPSETTAEEVEQVENSTEEVTPVYTTTIMASELNSGTKYNVIIAATNANGEVITTTPLNNSTISESMGFWDTVISMIPANPIEALSTGNILQIIIFGLFLGFGISALAAEKRRMLTNGLNNILEALIWCIGKVMYVAPFGVFGLIADATGTFGFDILMQIANLVWVDLLVVAIVGLGLYPLTIVLFSRVPIKLFFRAMLKPQIISFSTASSLATLPVNMEACDQMGVSKQTSGFVLPLGATINMSGNAIYYGLVAIFFAQFYGIDLGMAEYISIAVVCTLGAIGQAGVPGPTFLVVAVLVAAGIPIEGLPLLYALDRVFDMVRTTLNITGDAACAAVVDRFAKGDNKA
jgi:Na+/H+-dicarboxylate symporter